MGSDSILDIKITNKGLPAKSYTYILDLDYYLRMGMSILVNTPYFDFLVASSLEWKYKYKDRERLVNDFIKYLSINDESRINILFNSNFFSRVDMIKILVKCNEIMNKYNSLIVKDELTKEQFDFLLKTKLNWGNFFICIEKNIGKITSEIQKIQTLLINHYVTYIIKGLMQRRKGEHNPDKLKADAYELLMRMIDSYNPNRSKVPFHNYLKFFIRSGKNKVIQRELWNLPEGSIVSIDELHEQRKESETKKKLDVVEEILNNNVTVLRAAEERKLLVEKVSNYIPKPLMDLLALQFRLVDPLQPAEEIVLLMNNC